MSTGESEQILNRKWNNSHSNENKPFFEDISPHIYYIIWKQAKTAKGSFIRQTKVTQEMQHYSGAPEDGNYLTWQPLLNQILAVSINDPHTVQLSSVISPFRILPTHSVLFTVSAATHLRVTEVPVVCHCCSFCPSQLAQPWHLLNCDGGNMSTGRQLLPR